MKRTERLAFEKMLREVLPQARRMSLFYCGNAVKAACEFVFKWPEGVSDRVDDVESTKPLIEAYVQKCRDEIETAVGRLGGRVEPEQQYILVHPLEPILLCVPEYRRYGVKDGKPAVLEFRPARLLTAEEIQELKQMSAFMRDAVEADEAALSYYKFVGGSEEPSDCFEAIRYSGVKVFVSLQIPRS